MFARFLWTGGLACLRMAKILWKEIYKMKDEGGHEIHRLNDLNLATSFGYLWILLSDHESIWTKWVKAYHLRRMTTWDIRYPNEGAWYWWNLFKAWEKFKDFIFVQNNTIIWLGHPSGKFSSTLA